jgi:UDP-N-acetylglucosamine 2-epimerase (non-hydrolysing)
MHPRCKKQLRQFGLLGRLKKIENVMIVDPIGYFDFQSLQRHSRLVLTDSGGVQEECCILGVPCITLRDNTERPETLLLGANALVGANKERLIKKAVIMLNKKSKWQHPYGDGKAGEKIVEIVIQRMKQGYRKESRNGSRVVANSLTTMVN